MKTAIILIAVLFISKQQSAQCYFPPMGQPAQQDLFSGQISKLINFNDYNNVAGSSYQWTNDNTSIGLAAEGNGNIPAFTATNAGQETITANLSVIPAIATNGSGVAYIANYGSGNVSIVNAATLQNLGTIAVGTNPYGIAVSPDGSKVFVANRGSGTVSVISTTTNSVTNTITVGNLPQSIAINRAGTKVYVSNEGDNTVSVINASTFEILKHISTGNLPNGIAIHPNGSRIYVANLGGNSITVIEGTADTLITSFNAGQAPQSLCVHPDGSRLYVANGGSNNAMIFITHSNMLIATIPVQQNPKGIAIHPTGRYLYVSNYLSATVTQIDALNYNVVQHIPVGTNPHGIASRSDGKYVMVANRGSASTSIINTSTHTISGEVAVGSNPVSPGNFFDKSDTCLGTINLFKIQVYPLPTLSITASQTQVPPGETIIFTAHPTNQGSQPLYKFFINDQLIQSGNEHTFIADRFFNGDKVSCTMQSSLPFSPFSTQHEAISDTITISTQVQADYVFFPVNEVGLFSNPANWLNGNYPGNLIGQGETITFRRNGNFRKAVIDVSVLFLGNSSLEDSVDLLIPTGSILTIGKFGVYNVTPLTLNGHFSSQLTINGNLIGSSAKVITGNMTVNGSVNFSPVDDNDRRPSYLTVDKELQLNGSIHIRIGRISAARIHVSSKASLTMSYVYNFSRNFIDCKHFINEGYMFLDEGTLIVGTFENSGHFKADFIRYESLENKGSITIDSKFSFGEYAIRGGALRNYGEIFVYAESELLCEFGIVINDGDMTLSNPGIDNSLYNRAVFDIFINRKNFTSNGLTLTFTGQGINADIFTANGRVVIDGSAFINTGTCSWTATSATLANEIKGNFLNSGTIHNIGKLNVSKKFVNAGTLTVVEN